MALFQLMIFLLILFVSFLACGIAVAILTLAGRISNEDKDEDAKESED